MTLGGLVPVVAIMLGLLMSASTLGILAAPLLERRSGPATPFGLLLGVGIAVASTLVTAAWMLRLDVAATSISVSIAGAIGAATVICVVIARHGVSALRFRERQPITLLVAILAATVVLAPLAVQGFATWTAFVNDFHRYAASAVAWTAETSSPGSYLERFPGRFGETTFDRATFEKPMTTGFLAWASALTGLAPAQLLTPVVLVLLVTTIGAFAALLRLALTASPVSAAAIAVVASVSPSAWSRVMDAQLGHQHSLAMGVTALGVIAVAARKSTRSYRGGSMLVGITLAAMVGSNATLAIATLPVFGMLALVVALKGSLQPRTVGLLAVGSITVASALVAPLWGAFATSLRFQTVGLDALPSLPLVHPVELVGLSGSGPVEATVTLWIGVLAAAVAALRVLRRPLLDVGVLAAAAISAAVLGMVYGLESYELGKWLAVVVPLIGALLLGAATTWFGEPHRRVALVTLLALAASAVVAAFAAADSITRVIPAGTAAIADDPVVSALDTVIVDTGDTYRDSIVPLMVNAGRVVVAGDTYSIGGPPGSDAVITTEERYLDRGWTIERRLPGGLVLARAPLAVTVPSTISGAQLTPHLFGGWLPSEHGAVWSTGSGPAWIAFDVTSSETAAILRLSLLVPASEEEPRTLTLTIGERQLRFPPSPLAQRDLTVPLLPSDFDDGLLTLGVDLDRRASLTLINPDDPRVLEVGLTAVELSTDDTYTRAR